MFPKNSVDYLGVKQTHLKCFTLKGNNAKVQQTDI